MSLVIAPSPVRVYLPAKMALLVRLLALAALLLMPFGMSAPAAAAEHHAPASQGHCDGTGEPSGKKTDGALPQAHCAAACTALPLQPDVPVKPGFARAEPPVGTALYGRVGDQPETATPPPKLS